MSDINIYRYYIDLNISGSNEGNDRKFLSGAIYSSILKIYEDKNDIEYFEFSDDDCTNYVINFNPDYERVYYENKTIPKAIGNVLNITLEIITDCDIDADFVVKDFNKTEIMTW